MGFVFFFLGLVAFGISVGSKEFGVQHAWWVIECVNEGTGSWLTSTDYTNAYLCAILLIGGIIIMLIGLKMIMKVRNAPPPQNTP